MTREEIERFVRGQIFNNTTWEHAVQEIANRWEEDRAEAWNEAIQEGRSIGWSER